MMDRNQSTLLAELLRSFLEPGKEKEERGKRKEEAEKSSKCHETMVSFSELSVSQRLNLRSIVFQDRLTFLHRHMTVWVGWDS